MEMLKVKGQLIDLWPFSLQTVIHFLLINVFPVSCEVWYLISSFDFCLSWVFCARSIPLSPTPVSNIEDWTQQCCHLSTMELQPRPYNYLLSKSWKPRKTCEPSWKGEPLTNIKGYTVAFCYIVWNSGSSYWVVREGKNRSQLRDRWPWLFLLNCYFYYS